MKGIYDTAAWIIDGKAEAERLRTRTKHSVEAFQAAAGRPPGLTVVLVGNDPASEVYVRTKAKQAKSVGIASQIVRLDGYADQNTVFDLIDRLNADGTVDGILVQLPLPPQVSTASVLRRIDPAKDVDGFHPLNAGLLAVNDPAALVPCTPLGCLHLVRTVRETLKGLDVTIIGKSMIVGHPASQLFLNADCTVTVTHLATKDVREHCRRADVIVSAAGVPGLVKGDWVKPGAAVIDVGITRVSTADGRSRIVGDVAFDEVRRVAGAITPVPGGVGPMTVAMLLENTLRCANRGRDE